MKELKGKITPLDNLRGKVTPLGDLTGKLNVPQFIHDGSGISSYADLPDKPLINGVTLECNKTFEELGELTLTNSEIKDIIDSQFDLIFGGS